VAEEVSSPWLAQLRDVLAAVRSRRKAKHESDTSWLALRGEALARRELRRRGYCILAHRERSRLGEIDVVARDGPALVFVEVKTRRDRRFGAPVEAVDRRKRQKLIRLALAYTARRGLSDAPIRFDIVGVELPRKGRPSVRVYRNAFGEES